MPSCDSFAVFVVDPDDAVQDGVRTCLDSYGIEVRSYRDGCSFLRDALRDANGCVLVESELPDMSGLALVDSLRRAGNKVPILFLVSSSEPDLCRRAESRCSVQAIQKPLMGKRLLDALGALRQQKS